MKLRLKEDPKEWRRQAHLTAVGLAVLCTLLRWRHRLSPAVWLLCLMLCLLAALAAWVKPAWFRGYYRLAMRFGFASSQILGCVALNLIFMVIFIPAGLVMRCLGKDPLELRRRRQPASFWRPARPPQGLECLF